MITIRWIQGGDGFATKTLSQNTYIFSFAPTTQINVFFFGAFGAHFFQCHCEKTLKKDLLQSYYGNTYNSDFRHAVGVSDCKVNVAVLENGRAIENHEGREGRKAHPKTRDLL